MTKEDLVKEFNRLIEAHYSEEIDSRDEWLREIIWLKDEVVKKLTIPAVIGRASHKLKIKMYIVSLTHTMRHEKYVTLWRPNNAGYCYSKEMAGFYENPKYGYHDNDDNMPISEDEAKELFQELPYDGVLKMMIPNTKESWKKLGVKMTKNGLVKLS